MKKLVTNISVYDFHRYKTGRFVLFDKTIAAVGAMADLESELDAQGLSSGDYQCIDAKGAVLLPGLVVGHTHLYSTFARGWLTPYDPRSFQDILDQLWWKMDAALGAEEIFLSGLVSAGEYLKNGVTSIIDHHASGRLIRGSLDALRKGAVTEGGLRALLCFESSDRFDIDECLEENVSFMEARKDDADCRGLFGMHASFSLSDASLKKISRIPEAVPVHVHVAESREDVQWTKDHCGQSVLERFDGYGLLRKGSLLVHGVHLSEKDFSLIKRRDCVLAFNPTSNMNNGVGLPPVEKALQADIPWIIGNDGLGFHLHRDYQNLLFSYNLTHGPGRFQLSWLMDSIHRSYDYMNRFMGCKIGRIEKGYDADFFLVPYDGLTPVNGENIFGHFFYGLLDQLKPSFLWKSGELKIKEGRLVDAERYKYAEAEICASRLWQNIQKGQG